MAEAKREIWFHTYFLGLLWVPVSAKGFLVPLVVPAFGIGWISFLHFLGADLHDSAIVVLPIFLVALFVFVVCALHSRRG